MNLLQFPRQTAYYRGKVRDVYTIDDTWLVMIASDRISAFDVILPRPIPFKGQVLNQIAAYMLKATADICPNWLKETPAPNVAIGRKCQPFRVEMVVRGNLTGHAWRTYSSGKRELCGVAMPEGMREHDPFPKPIITPSTKAEAGHDEDISREEIIGRGLVGEKHYVQMEAYTLALFQRGRDIASKRGLILVDTKYEFGLIGDTVYLMDEIHTPDSSRYFYADGFEERQASGERQQQLSKEFVREWLIANHFMGKEGQTVPEMSDEWVQTISRRYIELYEKVIGEPFRGQSLTLEETYQRILYSLANIG
ncbi:MAG: phosphoribosylaminoimidazolesuccinocarboxamide synthase [Bacteroidota bacterium]|nr:phosphoribosylaminoimidazolesuccinocarboxamide synthase [Bacteroidota bacterium]MDP4217887.1 phosphoribosylaminoimidazolesuccinocarboxamide synthase [Bacteroidota bacterium]MDP4245057.1 phosphoribosylaminoimidazolesuccinocarboxamide synthase [Bacteroidota bacterium]MDP4255197.1 phosphoribosylaminoimidazolesuccinocarboxamide synthase [Bacteroidota bacterium]MDP4257654.1 phosphoribosylaminoimidazolesuccinocarboxamide synthase [Bacteroidota bacterium]